MVSMRSGMLLFTALLLSGAMACFSYSSYQDARIVPQGEAQTTLSVSASSYADRFSSQNTYWYPIELAPRLHLAQRFDAGLRFSFLAYPKSNNGSGEIDGIMVVGGDVRGAIIPNYLALSLPVAFALGANSFSALQLQPGAIATIPVLDGLDVNGSAHWYVYTGDLWDSGLDDNDAWGYTAGLGWRVSNTVTLRPEVGWLVFPDTDLMYTQYGLGLTVHGRVDPKQ